MQLASCTSLLPSIFFVITSLPCTSKCNATSRSFMTIVICFLILRPNISGSLASVMLFFSSWFCGVDIPEQWVRSLAYQNPYQNQSSWFVAACISAPASWNADCWSPWFPATLMGDPDKLLGSWLQPGSILDIMGSWGKEPQHGSSLSYSLLKKQINL